MEQEKAGQQAIAEPTAPAADGPHATLLYHAVADRLAIIACRECGIVFALPAALHAERLKEGDRVCCPNGHGHTLAARLEDDMAGLLGELRQVTSDNQQLRNALAQAMGRAAVPADARELKRRIHLIASRAETAPNRPGRMLCRFCGKGIKGGLANAFNFHQHMRRRHVAEISAMPASWFE